jgi:hypothetical protein
MWPWPGRYRDSEMPYSVRSIPAVPENRSKFVGHLVQSVLADGRY